MAGRLPFLAEIEYLLCGPLLALRKWLFKWQYKNYMKTHKPVKVWIIDTSGVWEDGVLIAPKK